MLFHYDGPCRACKQHFSSTSIYPEDLCGDCQYFNRKEECGKSPSASAESPSSKKNDFWLFFAGWPDRRLNNREADHALSLLPGILSVRTSGEGRWRHL